MITSATNVNGFWTGGYESSCRWYGKLCEVLQVSQVSSLSTILGLLFGVLAIVVKLHIVATTVPCKPQFGELSDALLVPTSETSEAIQEIPPGDQERSDRPR